MITFSLGRKTNLADKATLNAVFNELMPFLETRLQFNPEKRLLAGMSLGGWNALALLLEREEHFDRVALLPSHHAIHSWSPESDIENYIARTRANSLIRYTLFEMDAQKRGSIKIQSLPYRE